MGKKVEIVILHYQIDVLGACKHLWHVFKFKNLGASRMDVPEVCA